MNSKPWLSVMIQAAGALGIMFGAYKAFQHPEVFWPVVLGIGGWLLGWGFRHRKDLIGG